MNKFKRTYPKTYRAIKGTGKALQIASKAYGIAKTVAALVNSETKVYQNAPTSFSCTTTPTIINMITPIQGDGASDRQGNSIALKSILLKDTIVWNSAGTPFQSVRRIIVLDRNTTTAAWNNINELLASVNVIGLKVVANRRRFKVLKDDVFHYNTEVDKIMPAPLYLSKQFRWKGKNGQLNRLHMEFDGSNNYGKNMVYAIYFSNYATNAPTIEVTWEGHYLDN